MRKPNITFKDLYKHLINVGGWALLNPANAAPKYYIVRIADRYTDGEVMQLVKRTSRSDDAPGLKDDVVISEIIFRAFNNKVHRVEVVSAIDSKLDIPYKCNYDPNTAVTMDIFVEMTPDPYLVYLLLNDAVKRH